MEFQELVSSTPEGWAHDFFGNEVVISKRARVFRTPIISSGKVPNISSQKSYSFRSTWVSHDGKSFSPIETQQCLKSLQDPHALIPDGPVLLSVTVFEVEQQTMPESRNSTVASEVNPVNDGMFKNLWQDERECCVESFLDASCNKAQHLPAHQTEGEVAVHCDNSAVNPAFQSHGVSTSSQDPQQGSERVDRSSLVSHVEKAFDDVYAGPFSAKMPIVTQQPVISKGKQAFLHPDNHMVSGPVGSGKKRQLCRERLSCVPWSAENQPKGKNKTKTTITYIPVMTSEVENKPQKINIAQVLLEVDDINVGSIPSYAKELKTATTGRF